MSKKESLTFIIIPLFMVVSLIVSVYTLFNQSLILDEAQSLWVATKSVPGIIAYIATDVTVPLYILILHFWLQIFGVSVTSARALSLIFFVVSLPIIYLIAARHTNKRIALLTVALYSLSPFIIWFSFEARMYSLLLLIACISHYFFLKMLDNDGERGDVGYFFSTLFGLYTHYFYVFLIFSQIIYLVLFTVKNKPQEISLTKYLKDKKSFFINFFTPLFLAFALFAPWILFFILNGVASNTQPLIPGADAYNLFQTVINFLFGFQASAIQSILIALWPLSVVPIFLIFSQRKEEVQFKNMLYFISVTFIPIFTVFLISFAKPIFLTRYLIFTVPTFFILFSWILFHLSKQISGVILTLFAFIMFGFLLFQNISNSSPIKEDYKGVANYLSIKDPSNDIIAVSAPFTIYPLEYYYKGPDPIVTIPEWDVYKSGPLPTFSVDKLANQVQNYRSSYENIFVVLSYNQGYQKDIVNYMETHYKRILLKNFSPDLQVREYKLKY